MSRWAERVKVALEKIDLPLPAQKILLNVTPADVRKDGSHFDLPFAVSLMLLMLERLDGNEQSMINATRFLFAGEMGLNGELRPVPGVIPFAIEAINQGLAGIVVAEESLPDLLVLRDIYQQKAPQFQFIGFRHLQEIKQWLIEGSASSKGINAVSKDNSTLRAPAVSSLASSVLLAKAPDFDDMVLPLILKKAVVASAVGMHHLFLRGAPGSGKSMLARRLPSILPRMDTDLHLASLQIYSSLHSRLPAPLLAGYVPFRSPHHQASAAAIMGTPEHVGELSLAHGGVLFLDEMPEFRRDVLEGLREPLETGEICLARSQHKATRPAQVLLVAACNNCPCGWHGTGHKRCRCSIRQIQHYLMKLSGPILDRIDIHINMPHEQTQGAQLFETLQQMAGNKSSGNKCNGNEYNASECKGNECKGNECNGNSQTAEMQQWVVKARQFACERNRRMGIIYNRDLNAEQIVEASGLAVVDFTGMIARILPVDLSQRALLRCLKVSRTLADLEFCQTLGDSHLQQAWQWQADAAAKERGDEFFGLG